MVDIVMTSPSDFEKFAMDDCDDERKSDDEMEDGELPEEGEICDDDDAKDETPRVMAETSSAAATMATHVTTPTTAGPATGQRKLRDYDREEVASNRGGEGSMLSSWMTGVKQRTKPGGVAATSPTIDANEEYYGYRTTSPGDAQGDKDYRNRNGESSDKDYRWGSARDDDSHHGQGQDSVNEYGDSDYRPSSPRLERRRRRSPSPQYGGSKRSRAHSPPSRGSYRGRSFRGRWGERQICKFFREGYCRDGENCSYSHDASDSGRKAELCKFYQQGFCKKGLQCPLLHGEYPCKAFHKGECSKDPCQFSHVPLNAFTQPIYDQMMKDDELASRIAIPQGPLKRRVLLPGGPAGASPVHPGSVPATVPPVTLPDPMPGGVLPPPTVVVPTLSSAPPVPISQPQLVIPPPLGAVPHPPFPAFFPHHVLPAPAVVDPAALVAALPTLPMPPPIETAVPVVTIPVPVTAPQFPPIIKKDEIPEEDEEEDTSFNINKMLEQITSKVKKDDDVVDESPASPPMFSGDEVMERIARPIPHGSTVKWRLVEIDDIPIANSNIEASILQMSLTDSSLRNDPRVKKALSSQFDAFTNSLMNAAPPPLPQPAFIFQQQQSPPTVAPKEEVTQSVLKPVDPRVTVRSDRDPRKRSAAIDPRTGGVADPRFGAGGDPRLAASLNPQRAPEVPKVPEQANGSFPLTHGAIPSASTVPNTEQLYASTLPSSAPPRDYDHRMSPIYRRNSPPHRQEERGFYDGRRQSTGSGGWMPQMHSNAESRPTRRSRDYGNGSGFRHDYGMQDRDERETSGQQMRGQGGNSPPKAIEAAASVPTSSPGPISLREKRKNNEYESPLSRTRWAQ